MIYANEVLLVRIERWFNECVVASAERRRRAARSIESNARELERVLRRATEAGIVVERSARLMVGTVVALRTALRWIDAAPRRRPGSLHESSDPRRNVLRAWAPELDVRTPRNRSVHQMRRQMLRSETEVLGRLLTTHAADANADRGGYTAAQIRHLIARAQLGEISFAAAQSRARDLLAAACAHVDPIEYEDLCGVVDLLDWYSGAVLRRLYGG